VTADPEAGYTVALRPGTYAVDIPHQGIGGSRELPETVTIRSGETVRLNISVDTGIR
jgi:F420-0:gamma-glutamyl ligase-like protein